MASEPAPLEDRFCIALPDWARALAVELPQRLTSDQARMEAAVALARGNAEHGTGGPFGALVVEVGDGAVVSVGVNRVESELCSSAHAEIVALSLAQKRLGTWNLAAWPDRPLELVSSCEPCAMCLGAVHWSGVRRLVCGATRADAEAAGFDEGERAADWIEVLERRGIGVVTGVCREAAAAVLRDYRESGGTIYNP